MLFLLERCCLLLFSLGLLGFSGPLLANEAAWEKYRQGEFDQAIKAFQETQQKSTTEQERLMALYGEAHTWMFRSNGRQPERAARLYQQLDEEAPKGHPISLWGRFETVQTRHVFLPIDQRDNPQIVADYLALYRDFPESAPGQEAWINAMTLKVAALEPEPGPTVREIETFLQQHPQTPWRSQSHALLATLHQRAGQIRQQVEHLIHSAETQETNAISGALDNSGLYYQIGTIAEFQLGDFPLARKYYRLFLQHYSRDNRTFTVQKALERMDRLEQEIRNGRTTPPSKDLK